MTRVYLILPLLFLAPHAAAEVCTQYQHSHGCVTTLRKEGPSCDRLVYSWGIQGVLACSTPPSSETELPWNCEITEKEWRRIGGYRIFRQNKNIESKAKKSGIAWILVEREKLRQEYCEEKKLSPEVCKEMVSVICRPAW